MKLKKILAQSLAVAMVLSSVPVANFTALAAEDTAAYASDDASTVDATADVLPAPYGYKNLQLTVKTDVEITTSANTEITESSGNVLAANGANNGGSPLEFSNSGDKWINFHFLEAKKVSGLLYKNRFQTNGPVKIARVDVKKQGSNDYITVYQTETASAWTNPNGGAVHEALFNTVSDVTDVKFYAVATHYNGEANRDTVKADAMRILTTEDDSAVTATALTSDENSGTATVSIPDSTVTGTTMSVSKGVTVKYQAKEADTGKFAGWRDETGRIVSNDATYTTTVSDNITLTAVFKNYYERIDQSVLKENAKDNSHDNYNNDQPASAAFDGKDNTLWHQNWGNGAGSTVKPSASNPIWIQTSFGTDENGKNRVETVGRLTYRGRPDSYANQAQTKGLWSTRISDYVILAANVATGSPQAGDWAVVQTGTMPSDIAVGNAVSEVEFAPVNATHIRLVCLSTYDNDNYVCAGEINLYKVTDPTYGADLMDLNVTVKQKENENGNAAIVPSGYQTLNDANEAAAPGESASVIGKYMLGKPREIQLLAVPASGYAFASWKVNNEIVSKEAAYLIDTNSSGIYQPEFTQAANYTEITIPTDGGSSTDNPSNIRTNSETKPADGRDGPAYYAFDDSEDTHWHSNWKPATTENKDGKISVTGPIWIEAGFNEVKKVAKITYKPRTNGNGACRAKGYEVLVANMANPTDKPEDADFAIVKTGVLGNNAGPQDIILPTPVAATHVRLKFTSSYDGQTYVSASKIGMFEDSANPDKCADIVDIPTVESNNTALGTVETSTQKMVDKIENSITMTAKPAAGCHFVKWLITDNDAKEVFEKSAKSITETVNNNTRYTYTAMFAKDAEVNVNLDQTYVTMYVDDVQTLAATVTNAENENVTWSTDNDQIATVDGGIVTAVGAGEATITATSAQDTTKTATCTVVVNAKPSKVELARLINEVGTKPDEATTYTAVSREKLASALKEAEKAISSNDEAVIKQAENTLRDALDNLEALYMIRVNVGENAAKAEIITAGDDGEIHRDADGSTYIYAPLIKRVTVKADATNKAGVPFSHWYLDSDPDLKVMGTSTSYSFYVVGEMSFSAKYDAGKTDPEVNLFCSTKYSTAAGKLSFIAKRSVDKTYTVVEHGVIITDQIGWDKYYNNDNKAMIKGATRTRKSVAKGTANIGTYEAKLKAGKTEKWYGRSYVTYTDGYKTYTEYSDIASYPASK